MTLEPAFALIVACCRRPVGPAMLTDIRDRADRVENMDAVVRLADRHRVEPLVVAGLDQAGIAVPPDLRAAAERHRAASLREVAETLRIADALDQAGIVHRFLKGAALGMAAFGSPLAKRSWDIDLLVLPGQAVAAAACLAKLDYRATVPPRPFNDEEYARWTKVSKEAEFRSPSGSTVELHWRVSDHPHLLRGIAADGPSRLVPLLGAHGVATLADDANLAYLAVHGGAHGWFRLKWLADFNAFVQSLPDPADVVDRASRFGVGRTLDSALALAAHLFEGDREPLPPLSRLSLAALVAERPAASDRAASRARWHLADGAAYRWAELRVRLRGTTDRLTHPLAPRWQFLYPYLRLPLLLRRLAGWKNRSTFVA